MKKIFILLIAFLSFYTTVLAESNHFYLDEAIPGIYTMMDTTYKLAANYVKPVRKVETGEYVYCVTPGVAIDPDGNYSKISQNMWDTLNISKEKYEKIQIISYFGYMYKNHTDLKWYAITQYLIWQEVLPTGWSVYFTETLRGPKTSVFDSMINELQSLVDNYYKKPNLNSTLEGNYHDEKIYQDNNEVLYNYKASNNNVRIENNNIILSPSNNDYNFSLNYNTTNQKSLLYTYNNAQWVVSRGTAPSKSYTYQVKIPKGNIHIVKTLNYDDLEYIPSYINASNIKFALYNDKYYKEFTTDENGFIDINNLNEDIYYLKELESPDYLEKNDTIYIFNVSKNSTNTIRVTNNVLKSKFSIKKTYLDAITYEELNEANATFGLYSKDDEEIIRKATDENGVVIFNLPVGEYYLKQLSGLNNYNLIEPQSITIKDGSDINLSFLNKPIIKEDVSEDKQVIKQIEIENENESKILKEDNKNYENPQTNDNIYLYFLLLIATIFFFIKKKSNKKRKS